MTDVMGLVNYRRYFTLKKAKVKWNCIMTEKQIRMTLKKTHIILPKECNYFIETNYR